MNIAIAGLWHLGCVTAACMAAAGHTVIGYDEDPAVLDELARGRAPIAEPGLNALIAAGLQSGQLRFTRNPSAMTGCEVVWVCWDTPVDDHDAANSDWVVERALAFLSSLDTGTLVLISSQLPVGTTARLEAEHRKRGQPPDLSFAYSPENLRLGRALDTFQKPDRIVIGVRTPGDREKMRRLFSHLEDRLEWMSVESAEMTKHALNTFLATSVAFINEIAILCERTGADAIEVERGLKTDVRIGPGAYLHAGSAFAGGTLARDLSFLLELGRRFDTLTPLLEGALASNARHSGWAERRIEEFMGDPAGKRVAVLGLTYKPGTNTLRRSAAIELCSALRRRGAEMWGYDPAIGELDGELRDTIRLAGSVPEAIDMADAVLVSGPWPEFQSLGPAVFVDRMRMPLVLDPSRALPGAVAGDPRIRYVAIGRVT